MEAQVRKLFERYEQLFRKSLAGDADMDEVTSVYASPSLRRRLPASWSGRTTTNSGRLWSKVMLIIERSARRKCEYGLFASRR